MRSCLFQTEVLGGLGKFDGGAAVLGILSLAYIFGIAIFKVKSFFVQVCMCLSLVKVKNLSKNISVVNMVGPLGMAEGVMRAHNVYFP